MKKNIPIKLMKLIACSVFFTFILSLNLYADQGISDEEILIGMHTDISGPASMIGKQSVDGANMRFKAVSYTHLTLPTIYSV